MRKIRVSHLVLSLAVATGCASRTEPPLGGPAPSTQAMSAPTAPMDSLPSRVEIPLRIKDSSHHANIRWLTGNTYEIDSQRPVRVELARPIKDMKPEESAAHVQVEMLRDSTLVLTGGKIDTVLGRQIVAYSPPNSIYDMPRICINRVKGNVFEIEVVGHPFTYDSFHARIELAEPVTGIGEGTGVGLEWEPGSTLIIEKGEAKVQPPPQIDHERGKAPESSVTPPITGAQP